MHSERWKARFGRRSTEKNGAKKGASTGNTRWRKRRQRWGQRLRFVGEEGGAKDGLRLYAELRLFGRRTTNSRGVFGGRSAARPSSVRESYSLGQRRLRHCPRKFLPTTGRLREEQATGPAASRESILRPCRRKLATGGKNGKHGWTSRSGKSIHQ